MDYIYRLSGNLDVAERDSVSTHAGDESEEKHNIIVQN